LRWRASQNCKIDYSTKDENPFVKGKYSNGVYFYNDTRIMDRNGKAGRDIKFLTNKNKVCPSHGAGCDAG
jgi:hypothetical protein